MAVEHTAETGHDITLATHLVKNFDSYGEELNARVRDFVIESMAQPELVDQLEVQLDQTLESFKSIGECALAELLYEMETEEAIA